MLMLLFGGVQLGRIFYVYHTLQKALRGGAGLLARSVNVDYCDPEDTTLGDARNLMVFGNLQGDGGDEGRVVRGFTTEMIQILPERKDATTPAVNPCPCTAATQVAGSCSILSGGSAPDFVVVNLGSGFPLQIPVFPFVNLGTINLRVSVRMPLTGG